MRSAVVVYYLIPPDARATFLHNDLLCNDTSFLTVLFITYWGNGKDPETLILQFNLKQKIRSLIEAKLILLGISGFQGGWVMSVRT